jgi:hypothetical protein
VQSESVILADMESVIEEVFAKVPREELQRKLGSPGKPLSKQTMSDWKRAGYVPASHAVAVEELTGIERERLCPNFNWGRTKAGA